MNGNLASPDVDNAHLSQTTRSTTESSNALYQQKHEDEVAELNGNIITDPMESSSLLPLPPAPPPRTTSVQSNLSKLFHFAKNNKASHLAFHSKSFNVTKGSRTAQSSTHQSSESRAIISNESQESPLERSFGEACSVATGSSGTISRAYGECSTSSNSKDSLVCTPAKVSLALKGNSPGRPGGKQSTSEHKSELKKTSSSSWTCAASSSTTSTTCSSGGNGAIASGNSAASGVAHRVAKKQSKQPRPKSDMFFANPVVKTRERPIGRSASRYSTLEGNSLNFGQLESYVKLDQLGEGSYATVYKGFSNLMNKVVALKEIRLEPEEGTPFTAIREASLLRGLRHANIVTLHDIIHTKETLTFVFEFVHTDLSRYLEKHPGGLHPRNTKLFLFQLLRGIAFCHERRILHRDLKPQNLLISECGELKLADFGLARAKSVPSRTYSHEVVTLWYRPPDVLLGSTDYSTSLDIWGVGCIFIEMATGAAAFPGVKDSMDQLDKIWRVRGTPTDETWDNVDIFPHYRPDKFIFYKPQPLSQCFPKLNAISSGEELAYKFLQLEPRKRITAQDALRDRLFSDFAPALLELSPQTSVFTVKGVKLYPEMCNYPSSSSVMKTARLRR